MMRLRAMIAALCLSGAACSIPGDGSFEVTFIWPDGETAPSTAWVHARIEQRDDGATKVGRTLAAAKPVAFALGASLELPSVPDGDHRVVVIEIRQSADPASQVLYYGFSDEFSTKAGDKKSVAVLLRLAPVPGGGAGGAAVSTVAVTTNGGIGIVPGPAVTLRLVTDTGVSVRLSNRVNFSSEATKVVDLAGRAPAAGAPSGAKAYELDWDLDYGLPAHCVASNACERVVSVRFADAQGYESPTLTAQVRIDTRPPATLASGSKVLPAQASADVVVVVTLTATEVLQRGPALLVDGAAGSFALSSATPADQPSTTYLYEATGPAGGLWSEGTHALTAALVDLAGNTTTGAAVGQLVVDRTAPAVSGVTVTAPTVAGYANLADRGATRVITVDFTVSETPATGYPQVRLGTHDATCGAGATPLSYACTYALAPSDSDGDEALDILVSDVAGNLGEHRGPEHVIFDFTPPGVAAASVTYAAGPTNPLGTVALATKDTQVTISVSATETLGATTPALTVTSGPGIAFSIASRSASGVIFTGAPGPVPDGSYGPTIAWSDLAGNVALGLPLGVSVQVKTSVPTLVVDQSRVTFLRSPWGNGVIEDLEPATAGSCATPSPADRACIPAGPTFALAPPEPLSPARTLAADTFVLAGGGAPTAVRLWADPGRKSLMGMMRPRADGTWPRQVLASVDTVTAYATAVDAAGNESSTVPVSHVDWVATALSAGRANPHQIAAAPVASALPQLDPALASSPTGLDASDGVRAVVRAEPAWQRPPAPDAAPPSLNNHEAVFDRGRGRMVVFGGSMQIGPSSQTNNILWEWDGARWYGPFTSAMQPDPSPSAPGLVYDGGRGIVVYFLTPATTWEWDGTAWRGPFTSTNPPPSTGLTSPVYDSDLERVVAFTVAATGATGQAWLWDGSSWTGPLGSGAQPAPTSVASVTYDSIKGLVVLIDTASGAWHWDGSAWAGPLAPLPLPTGTGPMVYDSVNGVSVMLAGMTQQAWAWNGSTWAGGTLTGGPPYRLGYSVAFDDARGRTAVLGGLLGKSWIPDLYEWDGAAWSKWSMGTWPTARIQHAMAYDSYRGRVVLMGGRYALDVAVGCFDDIYEWDGQKWTTTTPATRPAGRQAHAMAYDAVNRVTVLFGGRLLGGTASDETWLWDGTSWGAAAIMPATRPTARGGHAMAYDAKNSRTVLFGGGDDQTWLWDGATQLWAGPILPTVRPGALTGHGMAYDSIRHVVVLFGGDDAIWEWDGASQLWAGPVRPTVRPSARSYAAMAYDTDRKRVIVMGGTIKSTGEQTDETWEWDGTSWYGPFTPASRPSARERHAAAYDSSRHELVLFGGRYGQTGNTELWQRDSSPTRRPALQLTASWANSGITAANVTGMRVRALCGGTAGAGSAGADLYGWNVGSKGNVEGWAPLGASSAGVGGAAWSDLIDWTAPSATEARHYLLARDQTASVRCLPAGTSGTAPDGAQVAADYVEVRLRYTAP